MSSPGLVRKCGIAVLMTLSVLGAVACGGSDSSKSSDTTSAESSSSDSKGTANQQNQNQNQQNQNQQNQQNQNQNQNQNQQNQNQNQQNQAGTVPTISIVQCRISGTGGSLTVSASSTASGGNKGVTSVYVQTYNDENATVKTDLAWLGPDTGNGDQWSTTRVAFGNGYKNKITVVAVSASGALKSAEFTGNGTPCPG